MEQKYRKVFVNALVLHSKDAGKIPRAIDFEGTTYKIDRLTGRKRAASMKVGGTGIRYSIEIGGKNTYLYEDGDDWYVEAKENQ